MVVRPVAAARLLPLLLPLLLLACQRQATLTPQQQAALGRSERDRLDLERCRRDQANLREALKSLERTDAELEALRGRSYEPAPRPEAPDPALAERFSVADQELDAVRHQEELESWRRQEDSRYAAWLQSRSNERQRLETLQRQQRQRLRALNSSLFDPSKPDQLRAVVVRKYSSCEPRQFSRSTSGVAPSATP